MNRIIEASGGITQNRENPEWWWQQAYQRMNMIEIDIY